MPLFNLLANYSLNLYQQLQRQDRSEMSSKTLRKLQRFERNCHPTTSPCNYILSKFQLNPQCVCFRRHPVMLLSIMRPCTQYSDLGSVGVTPNIQHTVGATVDGQNFIGQGRSKKDARKRVSTEILIKLFQWQGACC